jgi:AraC family transcriptional regulator of adaptative response / DNA-3-methyladenine glycosylase II
MDVTPAATASAPELAYGGPLDTGALLGFLAARAVPGVEEVAGDLYRRSVTLRGGPAVLELRFGDRAVTAALWREGGARATGTEALALASAMLGADPSAAVDALGGDPLLGPRVRANPGLRVPGTADPGEIAIRAVLGQQVSVAGARTVAGRLAAELGKPLAEPRGAVTHAFPAPAALAALAPEQLPMPRARGRALIGLAAALADGLDPRERAPLLKLPGIGPWTADYVALRTGHPDVLLDTDLGVLRGLAALGEPAEPKLLRRLAQGWRPYRSTAVIHLWSAA